MELIKRSYAALKKNRVRLGWSIASSLLGSGIGLLVAIAWVHVAGWR